MSIKKRTTTESTPQPDMDGPAIKKRRLSMACNECRRRKVRCDAIYPSCRNCSLRKSTCITSDPKRAGLPVIREWIEDKGSGISSSNEDIIDPPQSEDRALTASPNIPKDTPQTNGPSEETNEEVSPVYHPYEMSFHADYGTFRFKMLGGSSSQTLFKSLDLYLESANIKPISPMFQFGLRHAEELVIPMTIALPDFPPPDVRSTYVSAFFERIHRLWPMLDVDETKNAINMFASLPSFNNLSRDQIPKLTIAYLIISLGADEHAQGLSEDGDAFLHAAASLLGHLILVPYLSAVQALMLFTIAYRGRNKDGLGWQTIGAAIRIGHTLGLHRHSAINPSDQHGVRQRKDQLFHSRIWGCLCCLEKVSQLESGRPSVVQNVDLDQMMAVLQKAPGQDYLQWLMGLAGYQNDICKHIYHKPGERTAKDILDKTSVLDRGLMAWSAQIPEGYQPHNDLFCSSEDFHIAAFISINFHQAMISLHRAALIAPTSVFDAEIEKYCVESTSKNRLKRGESICVNSARIIIRLYLELTERKTESQIISTGPALLACAALAIYLLKNPSGRGKSADLELLKAAAEHTADSFLRSGQDRRFTQGVVTIYEKVRLRFRQIVNIQKRNRQPGVTEGRTNQETPMSKDSESTEPTSNETPQEWINGPEHETNGIIMPGNITKNVSSVHPASNADIINPQFTSANGVPGSNFVQTTIAGYDTVPQSTDSLHSSLFISEDIMNVANMEKMPFDQYNVAELWDWMFMMDEADGNQLVGPNGGIQL